MKTTTTTKATTTQPAGHTPGPTAGHAETVETLATSPLDSALVVRPDRADCVIIIDSETTDLDLLVEALKGQAKHGTLGEALRWLFLDEDGDQTHLVMKEDRNNRDWLEAYKAVYWFVSGWGDAEFYSANH